MKIVYGSVVAVGLIAGTLLAQQETVRMGQQMKDTMKEKMSDMKEKMVSKDMGGHREMTQLVEKLAASLTAIEAERDPTALAAKLTEHRKLIEQLQALVAKHGEMMGGMMAGDAKAEPTKPEPPKNPEARDPEKPADPHAGHH
jgi:phosphoribosylpyrophosphate synthetase